MTALSDAQLAQLTKVAAVLIPDAPDSPGAGTLLGYAQLLQQAWAALERDSQAIGVAIEQLPADVSWLGLTAHAQAQPASFELVSKVVVGAYFMSPDVLTSLGIPPGKRRAAPHDQAVNELGTGILDAVIERGSPVKTLAEITEAQAGSRT